MAGHGNGLHRAVMDRESRRFAEAAVQHRVEGYVVAAAGRGHLCLPADVLSRLESEWTAGALHAQLLRRELGAVVPLISEACGVEPVLIKGPSVADRFYADRRMRPFRDVDLLLPSGSLEAATGALTTLGYRREAEPWSGYGARHGHHVGMARRLGRWALTCELHWRISDDPAGERLDHARLIESSVRLECGHALVAVPAAEHQLLVLALHLLHEPVKRLAWVNDLSLVGGSLSEPAWVRAFAVAADTRLEWVLHRALDYAAHHLGMDRARPSPSGPRPPWGPLRSGERFTGWVGFQLGRIGMGGWRARDGYLRSAARARFQAMRPRLRRE
jgi:hypothetical protein